MDQKQPLAFPGGEAIQAKISHLTAAIQLGTLLFNSDTPPQHKPLINEWTTTLIAKRAILQFHLEQLNKGKRA